MTPFIGVREIELLMHYSQFRRPHEKLGVIKTYDTALGIIIAKGLLTEFGVPEGEHQLTSKGAAHVKQIEDLEIPKQMMVWVDQHGEQIETDASFDESDE